MTKELNKEQKPKFKITGTRLAKVISPTEGTIILPEGITSIGYAAFRNTNFTKIVIPSSVIWIENKSFNGLESIEEIEFLPKSNCRSIGEYAFEGCTNLRKINLPDSLIELGEGVFQFTKNLKEIHIPKNLVSLPFLMFYKAGLEKVTFAKGCKLTYLYSYCFDANIREIELPPSVREMYFNIIYGDNVEKIVLNEGLEKIKDSSICCKSTSSKGINITLPSTLKHLSSKAFEDSDIINFSYTKDMKLSLVEGFFLNVKAPFIYVTPKMTKFSEEVFIDDGITRFFLVDPENKGFTIRGIEDKKAINKRIFVFVNDNHYQQCLKHERKLYQLNCIFISEITDKKGRYYKKYNYFLNDYQQYYLNRVDDSCKVITKVLTDLKEEIKDTNSAPKFKIVNAKLIKVISPLEGEITIPDNVMIISSNAFKDTYFTKITIPSSVMIINKKAFYKMETLKEVVFLENSTCSVIEERTFSECKNLERINLPDTISLIGEGAFSYTAKLESIHIPNNLIELKSYTFSNSGVKKFSIDKENCKLMNIEYCAFVNSKLESLILPKSIKEISGNAFMSCKIKHLDLNEGLKELSYHSISFSSDRQCDVVLPSSIEKIDKNAFDSFSIKNFIYNKDLKLPYLNSFYETGEMTFVYVTPNMKDISGDIFGRDRERVHFFLIDPCSTSFRIEKITIDERYLDFDKRFFVFTDSKHMNACIKNEPFLNKVNCIVLKDITDNDGIYHDIYYNDLVSNQQYYLNRVKEFLELNK